MPEKNVERFEASSNDSMVEAAVASVALALENRAEGSPLTIEGFHTVQVLVGSRPENAILDITPQAREKLGDQLGDKEVFIVPASQ
ncbi:MAG: hypothetical protein COT81_05295 [Candidatus Buchananbacteria bacterium CG10_big_fil_rev_8_21_14_0_10_42_9]|uniref:Uncharacterized protein n=1 Tax=Candidatus Buchananbacteria bacterium CG10_big_fil_rev_8_21_14_0_10_42_9 TaxID=1974526 RepID=A0A2H0W031_9BACT|nr:MAG: hypothetical protein COT81_05295 [Candidatus Buchananbacteria bacterium CG10_big_fil_rev_8_21_14_0_10_42_9]